MTTPTALTTPTTPPSHPPCSICLHSPQDISRSLIPSCGHAFCAPCVLSWSTVRSACPLCKSTFSTLVVRRRLDGEIICDGGWVEEPISLLRRAAWVQLEQVNDRATDVHGVFVPLRSENELNTTRRGMSSSDDPGMMSVEEVARVWGDEEREEEREKRFWEEEEREWQEQRRGVKLLGNRRYGQNGYVSAGRMVARPARSARGAGSVASAGSSSSATSGPAKKGKGKKKSKKGKRGCGGGSSNDFAPQQ